MVSSARNYHQYKSVRLRDRPDGPDGGPNGTYKPRTVCLGTHRRYQPTDTIVIST